MKPIQIRDIGEYGLKLHDVISAEDTGLTSEDYVHFIAPLEVDIKILKAEDTILCDVSVKSRIETYCSRSLDRIEEDWASQFTIDFDIDSKQLDIDLQEDIRQEVILRLPVRVISKQEQESNTVGKKLDELHQKSKEFMEDPDRPAGTYRPFEGLEDIK